MKKINYDQALNELQSIAEKLQSGEIGLDKLSENIKRAGELMSFCKDKLRSAEEELSKVLPSDD
jgi:exodeoxyribonuclease VII small subunit